MTLSDELRSLHNSGDVGNAVEDLIEKAEALENALAEKNLPRIEELGNKNRELTVDLCDTKALLLNEEGRIEYFIKKISSLSNQVLDLMEARDSLESDLKALSDFMNKMPSSRARNCPCCGSHNFAELNASDDEGVSTWYYDCEVCGFEFLDAELSKVNKILQIHGK